MKYRIVVIYLLLSYFPTIVWGQTYDKLDSLLIELQNPMHDTVRFELLLEIGDYYYFNDFATAKDYFIQAKELAEKNTEDPILKNEKIYWFQKAKATRYIAYVYLNQGDYITASQMYFEALRIGESVNCMVTIFNCYNNIAILNHLQKQFDVAREYYSKALAIAENTSDPRGVSRVSMNLGVLNYDYANTIDSIPLKKELFAFATNNYHKALEVRVQLNDLWGQVLCYNNLGNVTRDGAELITDVKLRRAKLTQAKRYYHQSYRISAQIKDLMTLSKVSGNLSKLHTMLYDIAPTTNGARKVYVDSAKYYADESYRFADELNSLSQRCDAALMAKTVFEKFGYNSKALHYANIYIETRSELFSEEKTRSLDEMRIQYETEQKENEIELLLTENELKEMRIQSARRERTSYIFIAGTLLGLVVMLYILYHTRKKTNKLLEEKNKELNTLNSTKDKFISILAHDLKNPFSAFFNITSALAYDYDDIEDSLKRQFMQQLHQSAIKLNGLLTNMLEWAVVKYKSSSIIIDKVKLYDIVREVEDTLSDFSSQHGTRIKIDIPHDIEVLANKSYLSTILFNLLTNAIKFSERETEVVVTTELHKGYAKVIVKDNGIGIEPEDIDKLFRIDVDIQIVGKSKGKGTGLGLILCKELVDKLKGDIWVESKPNIGSEFIFTLPLKKELS